ncbi:MAG: hypothetical protein U9N19_02655 [Thermodesulfobacteriota bacterium]|nr:hypothetical protein [Thermodesulfobacteriota bacterium]
MKRSVLLRVNGERHEVFIEPNRILLDVLREELVLTGAKEACGTGAHNFPFAKKLGGYEKLRMRKSIDYSTVNIALSVDTGSMGRLVAGSLGAKPFTYEFSSFEELRQVPERVYDDVSPINDITLSPLYRKDIVRVLSEKLIGRVLLDNF